MAIITTVVICILALLAAILIWFFRFTVRKPPFIVEIKMPESAKLDEGYQVTFIIKNLGEKMKIIESIDIYKTFISNFTVEETGPCITDTKEFINFISFYINK